MAQRHQNSKLASEVSSHKPDDSLDEALEETFPASDPIAPADPELDERKPE